MSSPLEMTEADFDRLIKEIRASSLVALALLAMAAIRYVFFARMGPFASIDLNHHLAIAEILIYGTCAVFIWNFSLPAVMVLLVTHVAMVGVWLSVGFGWSVILGVLFALVLLRSIRGMRSFQLIRRAAAEKLATQGDAAT